MLSAIYRPKRPGAQTPPPLDPGLRELTGAAPPIPLQNLQLVSSTHLQTPQSTQASAAVARYAAMRAERMGTEPHGFGAYKARGRLNARHIGCYRATWGMPWAT